MIVNTSYAAPAGGGQFPLKTVKFTSTRGYGSGGSYYLNAKDLIDSGVEFSDTLQNILVTALLKKSGQLVATFTAPFVYSLSSSGYYSIQSCTASYSINLPEFDEQNCTISYYLTEN